ncbi:hypothetical protein HDU77_005944 [Chytriomyces hyalinus]|nr:hypothetical protein HDU77_005944 [Chytriomyces hyalinus]
MKLKAFVSGACYQDVILRVDSYPQEDAKVRAQSVEKRRGGNGANVLQVLSQFQPRSIEQRRRSTGTTSTSTTTIDSNTLNAEKQQLFTNHSLETHLVAVLAGVDSENADVETSFIINDLRTNTPLVSLAHCVFRGAGYSEPTAWIVATGASRTIINHTTLPELTASEFKTGMAPVLDQNFNDANVGDASPSSLWFHFEGRNVSEMEQMVDWLIEVRDKQSALCTAKGQHDWWAPIRGVILPPVLPNLALPNESCSLVASNPISPIAMTPGISPGVNIIGKRDSRDSVLASVFSKSSNTGEVASTPLVGAAGTSGHQKAVAEAPQFTISVEFEKPNRPGLDNLLGKADLLFFSKWYAEGRGFPNAPTGFLDNIRRECKQGAILFLTWSEQGCFFLVNDLKRPAQTHHVPAPQIFPVDTIGAGDTFAAGILYSMGLQKWDTRRACEFSVRLATAKCAQVGFDGLAERVI